MVDKRESDIGIWEAPIRIPFQERGFSDRTINALIDCQIDLPERLLFMSKKQLKLLRGMFLWRGVGNASDRRSHQ